MGSRTRLCRRRLQPMRTAMLDALETVLLFDFRNKNAA
jgi:hypothetical protein